MEREGVSKKDVIATYSLKDYPEEMQKKLSILQRLKENLGKEDLAYIPSYMKTQLVYVRKWQKLTDAVMFQLSNKLVQVIFNDSTEVVLNAERKEITYVDYAGKRTTQVISVALESGNSEIVDKIKYASKMLPQMLSKGAGIIPQ